MSDESNLYLVQSVTDTVTLDVQAGKLAAAQHDLGIAVGYRQQIFDPGYQAQADAYIGLAGNQVASLTPEVQTANEKNFNDLTLQVQTQVGTNNSDPVYQAKAAAEVRDIKAGLASVANGGSPDLGYNKGAVIDALPDKGTILAGLGLSLGVTTIVVAGAALLYAKFVLRLF